MPGPYKYPLTNELKFSRARVDFQAMEVIPPKFLLGSIKGLNTTNIFAELFGGASEKSRQKVEEQKLKNNNSPQITGLKVTEVEGEKASLHIQNPFIVDDVINYGNVSLGPSGSGFESAIQAGSGAVGAAARGIVTGAEGIFGLFNAAAGDTGLRLAITRAAQSVAGSFLGQGIRNAVGLAAGVTINPNLRTSFEGVGIRQFSFQFKFIPKSADESLEVKKIIRFFRFHAYPEEILVGGVVPVGYKFPNLFKIKLKYADNNSGQYKNIGTPIKMSYLRSVQAAYNPTQQQFHQDGMPTEIDLTLAFSEYKTLSRRDIVNEDTDDFYDIRPRADDITDDALNDYPDYNRKQPSKLNLTDIYGNRGGI